jgi:hypothetical protein
LKYFFKEKDIVNYKNDNVILGFNSRVFYSKKGFNFFFEGFCFITRQKAFFLPDTSLHLINKIGSYMISVTFSFFYNLIFSFEKLDFKKSKNRFRTAKITKYKRKNIFN